MRVSCSVCRKNASSDLIERLEKIGAQPIVTVTIIRAVYEGFNRSFGDTIIDTFSQEIDPDIKVYYSDEELGIVKKHRSTRRKRIR